MVTLYIEFNSKSGLYSLTMHTGFLCDVIHFDYVNNTWTKQGDELDFSSLTKATQTTLNSLARDINKSMRNK